MPSHASPVIDAIEDWVDSEAVKDEMDELFPAKRLIIKTGRGDDDLRMEKTADGSFATIVRPSFTDPTWKINRQLSEFLNTLYPSWKEVGGLSAAAKRSLRVEYEPKVEEVRRRLAESLQMPDVTLDPNIDAVFAGVTVTCRAGGNSVDEYMGMSLPQPHATFGRYIRLYFEHLAGRLENLNFGRTTC